MMFAYQPDSTLARIVYRRHINIPRFKVDRDGQDSEERSKEEIDEGCDDRELHDCRVMRGCIAKRWGYR